MASVSLKVNRYLTDQANTNSSHRSNYYSSYTISISLSYYSLIAFYVSRIEFCFETTSFSLKVNRYLIDQGNIDDNHRSNYYSSYTISIGLSCCWLIALYLSRIKFCLEMTSFSLKVNRYLIDQGNINSNYRPNYHSSNTICISLSYYLLIALYLSRIKFYLETTSFPLKVNRYLIDQGNIDSNYRPNYHSSNKVSINLSYYSLIALYLSRTQFWLEMTSFSPKVNRYLLD